MCRFEALFNHNEEKERRLRDKRDQKSQKELDGCTFKPELTRKGSLSNSRKFSIDRVISHVFAVIQWFSFPFSWTCLLSARTRLQSCRKLSASAKTFLYANAHSTPIFRDRLASRACLSYSQRVSQDSSTLALRTRLCSDSKKRRQTKSTRAATSKST